jgi:glucose/arabinose dehydrogenase
MRFVVSAVAVFFALSSYAGTMPGFRIEWIAPVEGFPTSIAIDSAARIYYTTTDGAIYRWTGIASERVASVPTDSTGNSGLLGMALRDDHTAIVHYTTPQQTHDVISAIDLRDGSESIITRLAGDIELPGRPTPDEHHGGNPTVAPDGTIYVGIGDYSWNFIAPDRAWNGGKIVAITPDGAVRQFARGLRNPFDLAWDEKSRRLIVGDNGPIGGDEIHIIEEDADCGWPYTYGTLPPVEGTARPDYVFPSTTAPTGVLLLNSEMPHMRRGFLVGSFVARTIFYFDGGEPMRVIEKETAPVIDLAQAPDGRIFFITGGFTPGSSAIYQLLPPKCGDCDGDGKISASDYTKLTEVLSTGLGSTMSWGCDVDEDGAVNSADAVALIRILGSRRRSASK